MKYVKVTWGPVTEVTINRPEVRNALNSETIHELCQAFDEARQRSDVDVLILTGAGEKAFCAGADLAEVGSLSAMGEVRQYFSQMAHLIDVLHNQPQPVIGAVFGYTLAGGMGLACGVDLLVASSDTRFGLPEVKVGLYPMVVTAPIARLIGPRRTLELGLTGKMIDAPTAMEWGLVNRLVEPGQAKAEAVKLAEEIRLGSPLIARLGKEGWRVAQDVPMSEALSALQNLVSLVALSDDSREGVRAFLEKRSPNWPSRADSDPG